MREQAKKRRGVEESGFTLIELMIATVVLLVGLVAVAQLVPMSILLNAANRNDSTSLVIAQRQIDQLLSQPMWNTTFTDPQGSTCGSDDICNLGDATQPNVLVGVQVFTTSSGVLVDFSQAVLPGYGVTFVDLNDPTGTTYDIRWGVITTVGGAGVTGRRIIVGVRKQGGNSFYPPVTLDSQESK